MTVNVISQTVEVLDVASIIVTAIVQQEDGSYVRELRIMTKGLGDTSPIQRYVLRLVGDTLPKLHVIAPSQEF